ncbi:MAG TPA: hypothetical protein VLM05_10130 [Mycobacteriales bacterium]|nr:hypothetical protein [Mycobacteriales bacterium]
MTTVLLIVVVVLVVVLGLVLARLRTAARPAPRPSTAGPDGTRHDTSAAGTPGGFAVPHAPLITPAFEPVIVLSVILALHAVIAVGDEPIAMPTS